MHFKKVLSTLLCGAMLLSTIPMASAAYQTPVTVTSEAAIFNVMIPTALPVSVNDHGAVTTATNATITNDSWGPIVIAGLAVTGTNNWATADYDSANMTAEKVDTKKVAMSINTCKTTGANTINFQQTGFNSINGKGGTQLITYDAKLPAQASAINSQNIVNTTFTVAWDTATDTTSEYSNPMTSAQVAAANLVFDSSTGTIKAGNPKPTGALNLPSSVDGVKVTSIGQNAFNSCDGLTSITIPNSITKIDSSAFYSAGLTSISIPNGVTNIGVGAFYDCRKLTSVIIPKSVTNIESSVFGACDSLASFTSDSPAYRVENNRYLISNADNKLISFAPAGVTSVVIPNTINSIDGSVFQQYSDFTSVIIPNSITYIGNSAFCGCMGLTSIIIPDSVTDIGTNVFNTCRNLKSASISNKMTKISTGMFAGCALESITIPSNITSIQSEAFAYCLNLSLSIPNSVTSIEDYAFTNIPHIYYHGTATGSPWGARAIN